MSKAVRLCLYAFVVAGATTLAVIFSHKYLLGLLMLITVLCSISLALGEIRQLRNISLAATSVLLVLLVAETVVGVATRIKQPETNIVSEGDVVSGNYLGDSKLGHRPLAGVFSSVLKVDGETAYSVTYTIDLDRTRVTPHKPLNDDFIVNLFGGSFAFGEGLEDDESLAQYLSKEIERPVKNYGFHGYGVHQAYAILNQMPLPIDSGDIPVTNVLLTSGFHAERSSCVPTYTRNTPKFHLGHRLPSTDAYAVYRHGTCKKLIGDNVPLPESVKAYVDRVIYSSWVYTNTLEAIRNLQRRESEFELYVSLIYQMKALSDERGENFIVSYVDASERFFSRSDWSNQRIRQFFSEHQIKWKDVSLYSADSMPPTLYIHEQDRHPSAVANQLRSQLLAPYIVEGSLTQSSSN